MSTHRQIWELFKVMFPTYSQISKEYYQCGKNGIRVVLLSGVELIFVYEKDRNWSLETRKSYEEHLERKYNK